MKVWIVESGEREGNIVLGVFDSEEKAAVAVNKRSDNWDTFPAYSNERCVRLSWLQSITTEWEVE